MNIANSDIGPFVIQVELVDSSGSEANFYSTDRNKVTFPGFFANFV